LSVILSVVLKLKKRLVNPSSSAIFEECNKNSVSSKKESKVHPEKELSSMKIIITVTFAFFNI
jgi:hypothetical protein